MYGIANLTSAIAQPCSTCLVVFRCAPHFQSYLLRVLLSCSLRPPNLPLLHLCVPSLTPCIHCQHSWHKYVVHGPSYSSLCTCTKSTFMYGLRLPQLHSQNLGVHFGVRMFPSSVVVVVGIGVFPSSARAVPGLLCKFVVQLHSTNPASPTCRRILLRLDDVPPHSRASYCRYLIAHQTWLLLFHCTLQFDSSIC